MPGQYTGCLCDTLKANALFRVLLSLFGNIPFPPFWSRNIVNSSNFRQILLLRIHPWLRDNLICICLIILSVNLLVRVKWTNVVLWPLTLLNVHIWRRGLIFFLDKRYPLCRYLDSILVSSIKIRVHPRTYQVISLFKSSQSYRLEAEVWIPYLYYLLSL